MHLLAELCLRAHVKIVCANVCTGDAGVAHDNRPQKGAGAQRTPAPRARQRHPVRPLVHEAGEASAFCPRCRPISTASRPAGAACLYTRSMGLFWPPRHCVPVPPPLPFLQSLLHFHSPRAKRDQTLPPLLGDSVLAELRSSPFHRPNHPIAIVPPSAAFRWRRPRVLSGMLLPNRRGS